MANPVLNKESTITPGHGKDFLYVGEMIPNQVFIQNLSTTEDATFTVTSGTQSWTYYGAARKGKKVNIQVRWPSGRARFENNSVANASILVSGNGIFPTTPRLRAKKIKAKIKKKKAGGGGAKR